MNVNNLCIISTDNLTLTNSANGLKKGNKRIFMDLMSIMMQSKNADENSMNLLLGQNYDQETSSTDKEIVAECIKDILKSDEHESKNSKIQVDYCTLMGSLMCVPQNVNPEAYENNFTNELKANSNVENIVLYNYFKSFDNITSYEKDIRDFSQMKLKEIPTSDLPGKTDNNQGIESSKENQKSALECSEILVQKKELIKKTLPEEFDTVASFKNDIDINKISVENEKILFQNGNKIIEVSDKSSEINPSVVSQIEDKIIFMAKDNEGNEGTQQITLELFPKSLGKVNIKMSLEAKNLTVEIVAFNEKAKNILLSNTDELTKCLQNNFNNNTVQVTVTNNSFNEYNQSYLSYSQQQRQSQRNLKDQNLNYEIEDNDDEGTIVEMINLRDLILNRVV